MSVVDDRIGFKIRLDDIYYNEFAQQQYEINAEKLMRFVKER